MYMTKIQKRKKQKKSTKICVHCDDLWYVKPHVCRGPLRNVCYQGSFCSLQYTVKNVLIKYLLQCSLLRKPKVTDKVKHQHPDKSLIHQFCKKKIKKYFSSAPCAMQRDTEHHHNGHTAVGAKSTEKTLQTKILLLFPYTRGTDSAQCAGLLFRRWWMVYVV